MSESEEKNRELLLREIIHREWIMFDRVQNIGGRAGCQDDERTFFIMRRSQMEPWDNGVLSHYCEDLRRAEQSGKNLVEQKYAYMMQYTDPEYFRVHLQPYLPQISETKARLVEEITGVYSQWYERLRGRYPLFLGLGRPETEEQSRGRMTSIDSYWRGELLTYSEDTLATLLSMVQRCQENGGNLIFTTYDATARAYGYAGLDDAENTLKIRKKA